MSYKPSSLASAVPQCEQLSTSGNELAPYSGWVLWSFEQREYFSRLGEYCRFHREMKDFLLANGHDNPLVLERAQQLPDIEFREYNRDLPSGRNAVFLVLLWLFFPLAYLWMYKYIRYINQTRDKIYLASGLYASIAFLLDKDVGGAA